MKLRKIAFVSCVTMLITIASGCQDLRKPPSESDSIIPETSFSQTISTTTSTQPITDILESTPSTTTGEETSVPDTDVKEPLKIPFINGIDTTPQESISGLHTLTNFNTIYNNNATYEDVNRNMAEYEKTDEYTVLWYESYNKNIKKEQYSHNDAITYAKGHWNDGIGL